MLKRIFQQLIAAARNVQPKQALLYAAVFCAFFFITFYLTFPFDTIKNLAITEIEARTGSKVTVASLSPLRMSGMEVRGVRMTSAQDPMRIIADIDLARFRLHLLPVFRGRVIVDYDLVAYGGGFSGVYEQRSAGRAAMAVNFRTSIFRNTISPNSLKITAR
ncbi:MAG: type II secretion system protein GspN [Deltaproteobacteria bacterium]|nr:type II secretion system protein GspN [Deltaproteobacteria bacterium]